MVKQYRPSLGMKAANVVVRALLALGVKAGANTVITVPGRKTGRFQSTPITILELDGQRYIQSPFGQVNWVRNLRAAGRARLSFGRRSENVAVRELTPEQAAPVLKSMLTRAPQFIRDYFAVTPESSLDDFARDAPNHALFVVVGPA
jgi:deazaflavin-dependent oxidoreductase (nitroreductase family)